MKISYSFKYSSKEDNIRFSIKLGPQVVSLTLRTNAFLGLRDSIVASSKSFFEGVEKKIAEGVNEDVDVEFDTSAWDKLMSKSEEQP